MAVPALGDLDIGLCMTSSKICTKCKIEKQSNEFRIRKDGKCQYLNSWCRPCEREKYKNWRKNNKETAAKSTKNNKQKKKAIIAKLKNVPCADCGIQYAAHIMQFDHLPERGEKQFNISQDYSLNLERILNEIDKCEVVCANCHADRTFKRNQLVI